MAELEEHREDTVLADPLRQFLRADAIGLADREDVVTVEDLAAELVQEVEDARRVGRHLVDAGEAVSTVDRAVLELRLLDVDDRVNAEAADALVEPEVCGIEECLAHFRVLPVEVRLCLGKRVQVVLLALLAPRPGRAAEDGSPVRRRRAVRFGVAPDVPVGLGVCAVLLRLEEPRMLVGAVVEDEVHDDADVALLRLSDELFHILHRAVRRVNPAVVGNIIAIVDHRRWIDRREPNGTRAERLQVIEMARDTGNVTHARPGRILETLRIDLIDDGLLPPFQFIHVNTPFF